MPGRNRRSERPGYRYEFQTILHPPVVVRDSHHVFGDGHGVFHFAADTRGPRGCHAGGHGG